MSDTSILKLYDFPTTSFIGGYYIPEKICDDLVNYFKLHPERYVQGGIKGNSVKLAQVNQIDISWKKSTDISLFPMNDNNDAKLLNEYFLYLNKCIQEYELKYPAVKKLATYGTVECVNIQRYNLNEGFYEWHQERSSLNSATRCFAHMTYLNDVEDGGTEFFHQKLIVPAKKGLTLIWPSDWTHLHKGQISKTKTKYILTGWLNYKD